MISDVLSDAVSEIDRYLAEPFYADMYRFIEARLRRVRDEMDDVRRILDAPPELLPVSRCVIEARARESLLRIGQTLHFNETHGDYDTRDDHHLIVRERLTLEELADDCNVLRPGEGIDD